ncbi:hypothetical protein [Planococcus sp. CAU13]|uniref:hypothetical protein n=1 Tax=Planococcus sp. CAU13 TaxID=1541197 RepID=UPI00052FEB91|nr:hypothetical protein [Planococcus sp. CAU13]
MVKDSIRTVSIFLIGATIFFLLRKFSYLLSFLLVNTLMDTLYFVAVVIGSIWGAIKIDSIISKSRFDVPIQTAAILLVCLFFSYQMFASHFYPEQYLKEIGLEKVEQLFDLGEQELGPDELRERAEEIMVKESAYATSLYGTNPWPPGVDELEVLDFERKFASYELVVGTGTEGETAQYTFSRDGLDFKISGHSVME